jgi:hypothetical protein
LNPLMRRCQCSLSVLRQKIKSFELQTMFFPWWRSIHSNHRVRRQNRRFPVRILLGCKYV